jgi:hypothetical protein
MSRHPNSFVAHQNHLQFTDVSYTSHPACRINSSLNTEKSFLTNKQSETDILRRAGNSAERQAGNSSRTAEPTATKFNTGEFY